jgi:Homeodomain-like domain
MMTFGTAYAAYIAAEVTAMHKAYVVVLTEEQRQHCQELVSAGSRPARTIRHAQILLKADASPGGPGWTDNAIGEAVGVTPVTVARVRKVMSTEGLEAALSHYRGPNREYRRKLDGHQEARLIALSCSPPPQGRERWTLRLLAGRMVELGYVDSVSHETLHQTLKKTSFSRGATCSG